MRNNVLTRLGFPWRSTPDGSALRSLDRLFFLNHLQKSEDIVSESVISAVSKGHTAEFTVQLLCIPT